MAKIKIIVAVEGGVVTCVSTNHKPIGPFEVEVVDYDDINEAGGESLSELTMTRVEQECPFTIYP